MKGKPRSVIGGFFIVSKEKTIMGIQENRQQEIFFTSGKKEILSVCLTSWWFRGRIKKIIFLEESRYDCSR